MKFIKKTSCYLPLTIKVYFVINLSRNNSITTIYYFQCYIIIIIVLILRILVHYLPE